MEGGIVYILSNPAMPGIYKIGITLRNDIKSRLRELFTTSVPVPFECEYACKVADCKKVESAIHYAFDPERINPQREFFKTEPDRVIAILKLLEVEDITHIVNKDADKGIDQIDIESAQKLKKNRRPPLDFVEMGIAIGEELEYLDEDKKVKVIVKTNKTVEYNNTEYSLTKLTQELLQLDYAVQPTRKWSYKGKNLSDIYDETYPVC
jgi:hypothetical protein